jgi:hypothetical protein
MELVLTCFAILAAISILVGIQARANSFLVVGWLWFLGTLFPVIGIVQAGVQSMADRYCYIPSIGISIMVIWLVELLTVKSAVLFRGSCIAAVGVVVCCFALTRTQVSFWRNPGALWQHAIDVTDDNYVAYALLGGEDLAMKRYDAAIVKLHKALEVKYTLPEVQMNLGIALTNVGRWADAMAAFKIAAELQMTNAAPRIAVADVLFREERRDEAVSNLLEALRVLPGDSNVLTALRQMTNARARFNSLGTNGVSHGEKKNATTP